MAIWRDVVGYEGLYQVSDKGDVKSLPKVKHNGKGYYKTQEKILKPGKRGRGNAKYNFVVLTDGIVEKSVSVHRLVADAFLENPQNFPEVNHKDENTLNNNLSNLEWCTRQYNIDYSKSEKISQYAIGGEKLAEYKSISVAAKMTGISRTAINNSLTGWSKTAGGYIWKYEMEE